MARGDLTDTQWAVPEPLLAGHQGRSAAGAHKDAALINRIRFRTRTGIPWRDLPERRAMGDGLRAVPPLAARRHLP
ncbi:transposase [Streptomyces kaniharaensis]|uniref:transposase n=1 Tax=Streptomyces kaniharaensis TaxID=212423 RepID=UPI001E51EED1|nr:transposase [Streptomyces kaniharaensis]